MTSRAGPLPGAVAGRIAPDATLLTDGSLALETYAKAAGLHHTVVLAHGAPPKPSAHINTVNGLYALWGVFIKRHRIESISPFSDYALSLVGQVVHDATLAT